MRKPKIQSERRAILLHDLATDKPLSPKDIRKYYGISTRDWKEIRKDFVYRGLIARLDDGSYKTTARGKEAAAAYFKKKEKERPKPPVQVKPAHIINSKRRASIIVCLDENGPMYPKQVGEKLGISIDTISSSMSAMVKKGYVRRLGDPGVSKYEATEHGALLAHEFFERRELEKNASSCIKARGRSCFPIRSPMRKQLLQILSSGKEKSRRELLDAVGRDQIDAVPGALQQLTGSCKIERVDQGIYRITEKGKKELVKERKEREWAPGKQLRLTILNLVSARPHTKNLLRAKLSSALDTQGGGHQAAINWMVKVGELDAEEKDSGDIKYYITDVGRASLREGVPTQMSAMNPWSLEARRFLAKRTEPVSVNELRWHLLARGFCIDRCSVRLLADRLTRKGYVKRAGRGSIKVVDGRGLLASIERYEILDKPIDDLNAPRREQVLRELNGYKARLAEDELRDLWLIKDRVEGYDKGKNSWDDVRRALNEYDIQQ